MEVLLLDRGAVSGGTTGVGEGNVLVCDYSGKVQEVTRDKKVVWQYDAQTPVDALRLPNGNTLITQTQRFFEVTPDKKVVWALRDWTTLGPASSTQLLDEPGAAERGQLQR